MGGYRLLLIALSVAANHGYSWSGPDSGEIYYTCLGDSVEFPWMFSTSSTESVVDIQWSFTPQGGSEELLANFIHGEFLPSHSTRQHLSFVANAGLRLSEVTTEDVGQYTVQVVVNQNGSIVNENRNVSLRLSELPRTTGQALHARLLPTAVLEAESGEWHALLGCGYFESRGSQNFSVMWRTPSNGELKSTSYGGSEDILALDSLVEEGNYSCFIEISDPTSKCAEVAASMRVSNKVLVEAGAVDRVVMSSRLAALQQENAALQRENAALRQENAKLTAATRLMFSTAASGGEVRLVNGSRPWMGRVEILYSGKWGTVCDDSFGVRSGTVVCRMLGLDKETPVVIGAAHYGQGTLPILLDDVTCNGNETSIFNCRHREVGSNNCQHSEDVGVNCLPIITSISTS